MTRSSFRYVVAGTEVALERDDQVVAVRYKGNTPLSARANAAERAGIRSFSRRFEIPNVPYTILPVDEVSPDPQETQASSAIKSLDAIDDVEQAIPVFKIGSSRAVPSNRIFVGFKPKSTKHRELIKKYNCTLLEKQDNEYVLETPLSVDVLSLVDEISNEKSVEYVEPDFVIVGRHIARDLSSLSSSDPGLERQYAARITRAVDAWGIQSGDPRITIAVLDEGVETQHEDLRDAIRSSFDAVDDDSYQEPMPWDAHGTACAGLAAAIPNNRIGIHGIGGGCSIMAIRIAYSKQPRSNWVTSNYWISRAIDHAWRNGADVLSNSWGGGTPSNRVLRAFYRARTQGRSGLGCVVIVAAGNDSGPVDFPGNSAGVLTVSASNEFDEFKTKQSRDGEDWWGSNFGPEVDLAAPGVKNLTTDIQVPNGYEPKHDYVYFNGTSSATPIVAGAAGLVLSANPGLTEEEVRNILRTTADKVGSQPYINGRNNQFGSGRLNVLNAIVAATDQPRVKEGTILPFSTAAQRAGVFVLTLDDGESSYLLKNFDGSEGAPIDQLELHSLAELSTYEGQRVSVTFARQQDTPQGTILWGCQISRLD